VRGAAGSGWQLAGVFRNVRADDCEIAVIQFPNVWTGEGAPAGQSSIGKAGAKSSQEHAQYVNIWKYVVNSIYAYKRAVGLENESRAVCAQLFRLLQEEREQRGLSKYALAGQTGLAQQTLGYVERGMTSPSFDTIYRMARAMNVDLGELILRAERRAKLKPSSAKR
jgi:DNA-binding XRE family transcriptional regulator